jgi:hypothetical protein
MWIQIFKTGKHTDSKGDTRNWKESDLDAIVAKYNPAAHQAPVVIGHPKDNDPAFGWVEEVKRDGQVLMARLGDLVPEFVEAVKKGLYKKRSVSLYPDLSLRHVGFLGAMPPAVKGLADFKFSAEPQAVTIEFADYRMSTIGSLFQNLRDWLIEKFGLETADRVMPPWSVKDVNTEPQAAAAFADEESPEGTEQQARSVKYGIGIKEGGNVTKPADYEALDDDQFGDPVNYRYPVDDEEHCRAALAYWAKPDNRADYDADEVKIVTGRILAAAKDKGIEVDEDAWEFADNITSTKEQTETMEALKKLIATLQSQLASFTEKDQATAAQLANLQRQVRQKEHADFCEGLAREGKLVPAVRPAVMDLMEVLSTAQEFEFAEGDKKVKRQPLESFMAFLSALPKAVDFSEVATRGRGQGPAGSAGFQASAGVDPERLEIHNKAAALAKEKSISYREALGQVL